MPLACSGDVLLFSDWRIKGDGRDNREGNVALGLRQLRATGVAGGYVYFDRRKSGESDKYHSQITAGAEWLAETWEIRGNIYVPTTGKKESATGPAAGSALSDPFLQGTGIFVRAAGAQVLEERPMHGVDLEAGLKLPGSDFWLHGGVFAFDAGGAPSLKGGRVRGRYEINDHLALVAEGQYDDQRGRQGWLGVRLSMPFGGPAQKADGLKARMTASPVRDVDIVTSGAVVRRSEDRDVAVINAETGMAQRVFYVDNTAAPGGDGSLDRPFNTLAGASAAANSPGDVIYIHTGDGTTTGQDQGITLNLAGQSLIGAGADFVYDSGRFITNTGANFNGISLIAATSAPIITNTTPASDGISVLADNIILSGFNISGATRDGISLINADGVKISNLGNSNNSRHGYYALSNDGAPRNLDLSNLTTTGNGAHGVFIEASSGGKWDDISLMNITANNNGLTSGGSGITVISDGASSTISSTSLRNMTANNNRERGILIHALNGGEIDNTDISGVTAQNNTGISLGRGVEIRAEGNESIITSSSVTDITATGNEHHGTYIVALSNGRIGTADLQNIVATENKNRGIFVYTLSGGKIDTANLGNITTNSNFHSGTELRAEGNTSVITSASVTNITANNNNQRGLYATAASNGRIGNINLENITATNNILSGVHVQSDGNGALITSASISNATTNNNTQRGILAHALNGGQIGNIDITDIIAQNNTGSTGRGIEVRSDGNGSTITSSSVTNVTSTQNALQGIYVITLNNGRIVSTEIDNVTTNNNINQGIYVYTLSGGQIDDIQISNATSNNNTGASGRGIEICADGNGSTITSVSAQSINITDNAQQGAYIIAINGGQLGTIDLQNIVTTGSLAGSGLIFQAQGAGSTITSASAKDITSTGNALQGVYVYAYSSGEIGNATLQDIVSTGNTQRGILIYAHTSGALSAFLERVTSTGNGSNGIFIDDDTTGTFVVDLGGGALGSVGLNRIFNNSGTDINIDLDGLQLKAENNWWGDTLGLLPARRTLDSGSTIDADPWLENDPQD